MNTRDFKEYNTEAIDQIKQFLMAEHRNATPVPFEVKVDGYIKIRKTDKVERFDELYSFVDDTTDNVIITLFIDSSNNEKKEWYKFRLKSSSNKEAMNGTGDVEAKLEEKIRAYDLEQEHKRTKEELKQTQGKLEKAEEYIDTLLNQIEESKVKPNHIGKFDLTTLLSGTLEGLAVSYPKIMSEVPVLNGISKVIREEHKAKANKKPNESFEGDVSFKLKDEDNATETEEHLQAVKELAEYIATHFNDAQKQLLNDIIVALGEKPSELPTIAELLNIETDKQ